MSDGKWVISPTGTYASGTYYGTYTGTFTGTFVWQEFRVDVLVSGTCWEIHTGTAEIEQVAEVRAIEGQWIIQNNPDNILVADVKLRPIRRNVQFRHYASGYVDIGFEFPLHFKAPATLEGNVSLLFDGGSSPRYIGIGQWGDYIFTRATTGGVVRINRKTGDTESWGGPSVPGNNPSFSIIDKDHIVVYALGDAWYMMDWINLTINQIASVSSAFSPYYPSWGVVGDVLCIGQNYEIDVYPPAPSYTKRWDSCWMFNIWTGEQLFSNRSPTRNGDAFINDSLVENVVVGDSFFWIIAKTSENGGTWPEVVGPEPAILCRMRTKPPDSGEPIGTFTYGVDRVPLYFFTDSNYGDLEIDDFAYNPEDGMLYLIFWAFHAVGTQSYKGILQMSPENLSYSIYYYVPTNTTRPPWPDGEPERFYRAKDRLYVTLSQGSTTNPAKPNRMYNVLNLSAPLWTILTPYAFTESYNSGVMLVDVNHRGWWMGRDYLENPTMLFGTNFDTGVTEIAIDTGIPESWGDRYYIPTTVDYRQVMVAEDCILIYVNNTIQYEYQGRPYIGNQNTYIYKVT